MGNPTMHLNHAYPAPTHRTRAALAIAITCILAITLVQDSLEELDEHAREQTQNRAVVVIRSCHTRICSTRGCLYKRTHCHPLRAPQQGPYLLEEHEMPAPDMPHDLGHIGLVPVRVGL